jgi:uncharacterized RDD family membrane protein YckC
MGPINPRRNKAFLIDVIIFLSLAVLPMFFIGILPDWLSGKAFILGIIVGYIYIVFRDAMNGQSIGKRIYKIQVVDQETKEPIGFLMAFIRGFVTSLPIIGMLDFLITTFTLNGQRLSDKLLSIELVIVK